MRIFNVEMRHWNVSGENIVLLGAPHQFMKATKGLVGANFSMLRMNVLHADFQINRLIGLAF